MSSTDANGGRITVSEDKLRAVIAEMELRFRDFITSQMLHKADVAQLTDARKEIILHDGRLKSLEEWRSGQEGAAGARDQLSARQLVVWGIWGTVFAGVLAAIATLIWLAVGG